MKEDMRRVNEHYGLSLDVRYRYDEYYAAETNDEVNDGNQG